MNNITKKIINFLFSDRINYFMTESLSQENKNNTDKDNTQQNNTLDDVNKELRENDEKENSMQNKQNIEKSNMIEVKFYISAENSKTIDEMCRYLETSYQGLFQKCYQFLKIYREETIKDNFIAIVEIDSDEETGSNVVRKIETLQF